MAKTKEKHVPSNYAEVLAYADRIQKGINSEKDSVAGYLLMLAANSNDAEHFQAGCESAENDRRAAISKKLADSKLNKAERKAQLRLPSCWSNPKSVILRGWLDFGMVPKEFQSFSEFQLAKTDKAKALKQAQQANQGGGDQSSTVKAEGAKDALAAMSGSITAVLFTPLIERISKLTTEFQQEIAHELDTLISGLEGVIRVDEVVEQGEVDESALDELEQAQMQAAQHGGETDENRAVV